MNALPNGKNQVWKKMPKLMINAQTSPWNLKTTLYTTKQRHNLIHCGK